MGDSENLDVKCEDFIENNPRLYAHKARRKKIAMIRIEAANRGPAEMRLLLGESKLMAGEKSFEVETPAVLVRKLSEFTWDMLVFLVLDFHPLLSLIDFSIFLTGSLYNRLLRRKLSRLTDGVLVIDPGKTCDALVGFRGVPRGTKEIRIAYLDAKGKRQEIRREVR